MSRTLIATIIFLTCFVTFAYLTQREDRNPQVVTRVALTLEIIERGALDIDRFENQTIDKAFFDGHFYADKVPGLSLLAVPIVAIARTMWQAGGETRAATDPALLARYVAAAAIGTVSVLGALAAAILYLFCLRLGVDHQGAMLASFTLAMATPYFGWSTAFFAHAATGSLLLLALVLIVRGVTRPIGQAGLGLLMGLTLVIDLTAAPAVVILGILFVWKTRSAPAVLYAAVGGAAGLVPLLTYNALAFGSLFKLGYSSVVGFEGMQQGLFGVGLPSLTVLVELLFGLYRGLLPLSPVLALVPVGLWAMWRRPDLRPVVIAIVLIVISYFWINSSYHYWDGGASTGPRHIIPALPVAAIAIAFLPRRGFWWQVVIAALLVISLVLSVICASTDMYNTPNFPNPFFERLLPHFVKPENVLRAVPVLVPWLVFVWLFRVTPTDQPRSATS